MKRILAACLQQTVHFKLKDGVDPQLGARLVREEYETYKLRLERSRTRYQILEESTQPDGSIIIRIKKQYLDYDVGSYI